MKTKTFKQFKDQEARIDRMMWNDKCLIKDANRNAKWCALTNALNKQICTFFGVDKLWHMSLNQVNEPLPYEVRTTSI